MKDKLSPLQRKVLTMLENGGELGVINFEFPKHYVLSYRKRISELRALGYNIETHRAKGMRGINFYRLVPEEEKNE